MRGTRHSTESDHHAERRPLAAALEAALFSADEPIPPRRLATIIESPRGESMDDLIEDLRSSLDAEQSALEIVERAGGVQLLTRPEYFPWLTRLRHSVGDGRLSPTLLESLAIVAYRQPIMRADLEAIRGVHCGDSLRELMERGLVRIVGRDCSLGRPILYGTTQRFLQLFGLRNLQELPPIGKSGP